MPRRVLITGPTGFIGRTLVRHALEAGWVVRAAIRTAAAIDGCEPIVTGEISGRTDWSAACAGVDVVFHLAGLAHETHERQAAAVYEDVNAVAAGNLAAAAATARVRRLVYVSTAKVAGDVSDRPFRESDPPQPGDVYARSKLRGEQLVIEAAREHGMEFSILRPPLVYGPGVRANFLALVRAVDRGVPLPLAGVKGRRSYIGVDNLADALLFAATSAAAANQILFVSDGDDVSTAELIRRIGAALNRPARLFRVPLPLLGALASLAGRRSAFLKVTGSLTVDSSRIRSFGWRPPLTMTEELATLAEWYRGTPR